MVTSVRHNTQFNKSTVINWKYKNTDALLCGGGAATEEVGNFSNTCCECV